VQGGIAPSAATGAAVRAWLWHFDGRMGDAVIPTYRDLLAEVPPDTRIVVAVGSPADARRFRAHLGLDLRPDARVQLVDAGRHVSMWARDRYVVFERQDRPSVLVPPERAVPEGWAGDLSVARALARWEPSLRVVESPLHVEGGNVLLTRGHVITGPATVLDNAARLGADPAAVRAMIAKAFDRELVVVETADPRLAEEHVDMYLSVAGERQLLLGDPRLALACDALDGPLRELGTFDPETQKGLAVEYDRIAARLRAAGFAVARVPILHATDEIVVSWNNAVVEERDGRRLAYVPRYGLPDLDAAAHACWRRLGFEVRPVSAERVVVLGGSVRCVTNTLP
jgi:hypothetical protein